MYKIRFHLGKGQHFMHWQVKDTATGEVTYHDPIQVDLCLVGAKLRNRPATAQKIHGGADKTVCAWIEAVEVLVTTPIPQRGPQRARYNPRVAPYWRDPQGANIDGAEFDALYTHGGQIY